MNFVLWIALQNELAEPPGDRGDECGTRNGKHPGPDYATSHSPAHSRNLLRRAHTDDGPSNGMSGRNGHAQSSREEQRDRAARLGAKSPNRFESGDSLAHGFDDAPAAEQRSHRDRSIAGKRNPE